MRAERRQALRPTVTLSTPLFPTSRIAAWMIFQGARFENCLQKFPRETGRRRPDNRGVRVCLANCLAAREGEGGVLLRVWFRLPEVDVRFVPDFPNDFAPAEMLHRRRRPFCVRRHAFRMLWRCGGLVLLAVGSRALIFILKPFRQILLS